MRLFRVLSDKYLVRHDGAPTYAEQNEKVYRNHSPVAYQSTDGGVYIDILEDRYKNAYSSHVES
jgi:hypothetical protein